jgi:hypothetical protein
LRPCFSQKKEKEPKTLFSPCFWETKALKQPKAVSAQKFVLNRKNG